MHDISLSWHVMLVHLLPRRLISDTAVHVCETALLLTRRETLNQLSIPDAVRLIDFCSFCYVSKFFVKILVVLPDVSASCADSFYCIALKGTAV